MVDVNIVVSFASKGFGIGVNNNLPWHIPDDLARFARLTKGSVVVMGHNTWMSIPQDKRPLKERLNVVVTSKPSEHVSKENVVFLGGEELDSFIACQRYSQTINVIGGVSMYKRYMGVANRVYATVVENDNPPVCDTFFPVDNFDGYDIEEASEQHTTPEGIKYRYITYIKRDIPHDEYVYLHLLQDILDKGKARPDRTGVGTVSVFGRQMRFDISKSVPFLTTKFLAWKSVIKELLWFMRGETDSKILEAQGVGIWKGNTSREFLDKRGLSEYQEGDIGPLYGVSFRSFGCEYKGCGHNHVGEGFDQLTELLHGLKNDPFSRRHLLTTYNPSVVSKCVLAPCHGIAIQFYVEEEQDGKMQLSCHVYCRSQDTFLGTAFNIASYAIMTYIIAKKCSMTPRELIISTGDTHIYHNHIEQVKTQLKRKPFPFPVLELSDDVIEKDFSEITVDDFRLIGYMHHPSIKAEMAV